MPDYHDLGGNLRLCLERDLLGHVGLLAMLTIGSTLFAQEPLRIQGGCAARRDAEEERAYLAFSVVPR